MMTKLKEKSKVFESCRMVDAYHDRAVSRKATENEMLFLDRTGTLNLV